MPTDTSARPSDKDAVGQAETGQTSGVPQLVDLIGDVNTRRRESLHKEVAKEGLLMDQAIGEVHLGIPEGRQATAGNDGRRRCGKPTD